MIWSSLSQSLTPHQRETVSPLLSSRIAILGGSPGTGKTFTAAQIIKSTAAEHGETSIKIAAPTGKAAVRINESMQKHGVYIRARTIHSMLGVQEADGGGGWSFVHNRSNPLECQFLVVDESSMIDCDLMASLLAARPRGCSILFVGDVGQLPPVGHGAPLRDMIAAGIPYGELTEIQRNAGAIVNACAAIRRGESFEQFVCSDAEKTRERNLIWWRAWNTSKQ
jgi:exodeoxyribonuclease V alpha subunit